MEKITFGTLANAWLEHIKERVSKNTYDINKGYIKNYMLPYFDGGEQSVDEVNVSIESYVGKIEASERAELVKKLYPVFSQILDYAVMLGYIKFNYARVIVPFAKIDELTYADIGLDELAAILSQAKYDDMLLDFILILDCGLSRGEILGLKWGDIDLDNKNITVNRMVVARSGVTCITDAPLSRIIPITDITANLLGKKIGGAEEFIIPSPSGGTVPFNPSAYRKKIDKVIKKALDGESITIETLGYILSIVKDISESIAPIERADILYLALEKSKAHKAIELKYRKSGTGYVKQIGPHTWQGRYTPTVNGRRVSYNTYAGAESECEEKLAKLIEKINKEIGR